jgi:DNA repair exonuclease SbcCD ATPase subunit
LRGSAEVAGRVIQRAREGHPVFTRLMTENPEIQNGARAYFNRELFGGGRVPTVDSLRTFVQKNEGVLKQLGLYDEFSTVASARASGQRALDAVKAELTQAKAAQKAATTSARQAERAITEQERLRGAAAGRVAETEKAAVAPEKIATEAEKRAAKAEAKLSEKAKAPTAAKSAAETRADALKQSTEELDSVDLKGVTKKSTSILKDLRSRNVISSDEYTKMLDQINMIDKAYGESEKARTMAKRILYGGLAAVGTEQLIQRYVFGGK